MQSHPCKRRTDRGSGDKLVFVVLVSFYNTMEIRLTATPLLRSPRYYGLFSFFRPEQTPTQGRFIGRTIVALNSKEFNSVDIM